MGVVTVGIRVVSIGVVCMCASVLLSVSVCHMYDVLLNPNKSDVALYGTRPGLKRSGLPSSISIAGCAINVSERLKILGVTLDVTLSFDDYITSVV